MNSFRPRPAFLYLLFFLSGTAGMGCQMIWVRMFTAGLGHEVPSMISVTAAFLGGMALGAWLLDGPVSRSANPGRWYAGLEFTIGAWGLIATAIIPLANQIALQLIGANPSPARQWFVTLLLPFFALLPATAAMGATLAAMDRFLAPLFPNRRCIGALYAANTLGAVAGTLGGVFLLAPALGFRASGWVLAAINLGCGLAALALAGRSVGVPLGQETPNARPVSLVALARLRLTVFTTGLLGIGYELVGVRVLSQVLENTIYTFASVLSVYLIGTALGAAIYQRFGRRASFCRLLFGLLIALASACLLGVRLMRHAPEIYDWLRSAFGDSIKGVLLAEMSAAAAVFGLPTLVMGATFGHLVQGTRRGDGGVGRAVALNALGCALAAPVFMLWLLPAFGTKWTLAVIAVAYLLLLPRIEGRGWVALAVPVTLFAALPGNLQLLRLPPGANLRDYREGVMASVSVVETPDGNRSLRVNHRLQMGGTAAAIAERREAHLPLLLHPAPRRALFLGPGTGITLGAAGAYPNLVSDGVELLPEVVAVMGSFEPENNGPFPKPGATVSVADARRFVRTTTNRYDVIVGDLFHPAQDGAGFLYTREHFQAIRARLQPGGLFCQWLPLHQLDEATLRVIIRTFLEVFPRTHAALLHFNVDIPVLGLVGTLEPLRVPADWPEQRAPGADLQETLKGVGLDRSLQLPGCIAAGPEALSQFAEGATLNTDNNPVVTFLAPRFSYQRRSQPGVLLLKFVALGGADARSVVLPVPGADADAFVANLNDFIVARNLYLQGLVEESAGHLTDAINLYLAGARRSLHFTSAYARCVTIIQMLSKTDRAAARRLFERLEEAQPAQPLGRRLLGPLFDQESK